MLEFITLAKVMPKVGRKPTDPVNAVQRQHRVLWFPNRSFKGFRLLDELMVISFNGEKFSSMTSTNLSIRLKDDF